MSGYTPTELDDVQAKWKLRFPPDLLEIYRQRRHVVEGRGFDWVTSPDRTIWKAIVFPLRGYRTYAHRGQWSAEWGPRPPTPRGAEMRMKEILAAAPKLIPICGHRCIPETPHEAGNPVFSVFWTDIIVYGADLANYVRRETDRFVPLSHEPKEIPFWSAAVRFSDLPEEQAYMRFGDRPFFWERR